MGKKAKNHAQFVNEELETIEIILVKVVKEIQKSLDKNPKPKELAKKAIRSFNSDVTRADVF